MRRNNIEIRKTSTCKSPVEYYFEIVKWQSNKYFGRYDEFIKNGYKESFLGYSLEKDGHSISVHAFTGNPETCFTIASWGSSPPFKFRKIQDRFNNLDNEEKAIFEKLYIHREKQNKKRNG